MIHPELEIVEERFAVYAAAYRARMLDHALGELLSSSALGTMLAADPRAGVQLVERLEDAAAYLEEEMALAFGVREIIEEISE